MKGSALKKRVEYFFSSSKRGRSEPVEIINEMMKFGPMVVIGGMIRDLAVLGNKNFCSDLDLVINPSDVGKFDRFMSVYAASKNKYGGYQLVAGRWKVEVWPLERTWAKEKNYVDVKNFRDLLNITFFNWDAILYDITNRQLISSEHYFNELERRILDINLRHSLNPLGNAIRALRSLYRYDAKFSYSLSRFVFEQMASHGVETVLEKEKLSFPKTFLHRNDLLQIQSRLAHHLESNRDQIFDFNINKQMALPLEHANM